MDTQTVQLSKSACTNGLHVMELFAGVGLGVLRSALAAGYSIRCYTYVDKDPINRNIARSVLSTLQQQYPTLLPDAAIKSFDKRLPQDISQCSLTFLERLLEFNGPVDLLGGSWECQSVSRAGRQRGAMDPRFRFFYDLVRITNFFRRGSQPHSCTCWRTHTLMRDAQLQCRRPMTWCNRFWERQYSSTLRTWEQPHIE